MRAHRLRHDAAPVFEVERAARRTPKAWPQIYECSGCEQRLVDERRCPDCNLFARKLGPGAACPHCDEPVLLTELLGDGAVQ